MLPIGLDIQIIGFLDKRKLRSRVIGWVEGEYIIIEHPMAQGEPVLLPKDAAVICRGLSEGRLYGFKSHVLHTMTKPFPYLFLVYPREIEVHSARKGAGVDVDIVVSVVLSKEDVDSPPEGAEKIEGKIQNLSASGCLISFPPEVEPTNFAFLSFELPDKNSVTNLKGTMSEDQQAMGEGSYELEFNEEDSSIEPVFNFVHLANKILAQTDGGGG